ncbi:hypothetical protein ACVWYH_005198 [Bradyrhizobium sp. GM24.11]
MNWLPLSVLKISGVPYFASASSRAATQNETSIVFDNRHARTARLAQSMMPTVFDYRESGTSLLQYVATLPSYVATVREAKGPVKRVDFADVEAYARGEFLTELVKGKVDKEAPRGWLTRSPDGESTEAWCAVLDKLIRRGLRRPEFLIVDGAPGLEAAIAAVWDGVPVQRCTVHKHRNLLAHAPERLHEEITADYNDMIYGATREEIEVAQGLHPQMAAQASCGGRQPAGSRRPALHLHATAAESMEERTHHECNRAAARRVQATDQDADRVAISGHRGNVVLGFARFRPDQHAQGRRLENAGHQTHRSAN